MIVARAPLRVSFAGGGSDLPAYFMNSTAPGTVVSAAIQQYVYVIVNKKFDNGVRVGYSVTENVLHVSEIKHDRIRETLKYFDIRHGIEVVTVADVPGRGTGLGSSSALTVALICALAKYTDRYYTPYDCARLACEIEIDVCGHPIGYQDQFASAFGGLNKIEFRKRETRVDRIEPLAGLGSLEDNLILFYLGQRESTADDVLKLQHDQEFMQRTRALVALARQVEIDLWANNLDRFGAWLDSGWKIKKTFEYVSNPKIDEIYQKALDNGACGGKVLGAGGGGFLLLFAAPDRHAALRMALDLKSLPVKIDRLGVRIVDQR